MNKDLKDRIQKATTVMVCPDCYQSVPYGHSAGRCFKHKDLPAGYMGAVPSPFMSTKEMQELISDLQVYIENLEKTIHAQLPT